MWNPEKNSERPVIRWDDLKDEEYPNGCWVCTVDDPDEVYDKFLGNTPDEAFAKWAKDWEESVKGNHADHH